MLFDAIDKVCFLLLMPSQFLLLPLNCCFLWTAAAPSELLLPLNCCCCCLLWTAAPSELLPPLNCCCCCLLWTAASSELLPPLNCCCLLWTAASSELLPPLNCCCCCCLLWTAASSELLPPLNCCCCCLLWTAASSELLLNWRWTAFATTLSSGSLRCCYAMLLLLLDAHSRSNVTGTAISASPPVMLTSLIYILTLIYILEVITKTKNDVALAYTMQTVLQLQGKKPWASSVMLIIWPT